MEHDEPQIEPEDLPEFLYHIVPINIFQDNTDIDGNYDPRNNSKFGGNSPFIHTTPSIEQINKYLSYFHHLTEKQFYLIEIQTSDLKIVKATYNEIEGMIYHHLWGALNKGSYRVFLSEKDENQNLIRTKEISQPPLSPSE